MDLRGLWGQRHLWGRRQGRSLLHGGAWTNMLCRTVLDRRSM